MADASSPSMLSRLIAETFGTFMLVFGVIGAALFISSATGPLAVALGKFDDFVRESQVNAVPAQTVGDDLRDGRVVELVLRKHF